MALNEALLQGEHKNLTLNMGGRKEGVVTVALLKNLVLFLASFSFSNIYGRLYFS